MTATLPIAKKLRHLIATGVHRIGEIEIVALTNGGYHLCHFADLELARSENFGGLSLHCKPADAREIATFADDGSYRFIKAQVNLKRGWLMRLTSDADLREALDLFYPAAAGLWFAFLEGRIEIQTLREKLARQTGMYRFAKLISDAGAQRLVREVCGPDHCCARRILWQIDGDTPLEDSEASRYDGLPTGLTEREAIPLICREACNHFVAECRKVSKAESIARSEGEASAGAIEA
jgi:hypothetical protein